MNEAETTTPQALEALAWRCLKSGRPREALAACRHLTQRFADYTPGWYTGSQIALQLNQPQIALRAAEELLRRSPGHPGARLQQAHCILRLGREHEARELLLALDKNFLQKASLQEASLQSAYQHSTLALLLSRLDLHERALHHYQCALRLEPEVAEHYYNLATIHRFLGNTDAADAALGSALGLDPGDAQAHKLRSDLRRQTVQHNHVAELRAAIDSGTPSPRDRATLFYALGKELEDLERWPEAFEALRDGANGRRTLMRYDVEDDVETLATIARVYHREFMARPVPGDDSDRPIFVVGMPRTGTTLVERILGSHSQVHAAGELHHFAKCMSHAVAALPEAGSELTKQARVELSAGLDFAGLGRAYLESVPPAALAAPRFVDKMPLNFLYLGLIHRALPRARIIHLRRHPMDTCFAIYKTLFADAYPFSYNLEELADYYLAYHRLMAHWESVLPGAIHTLSYERLVTDFESECRKLLTHCGLPWEDDCLDFHRNRDASTTASASQVREPVHDRSVGRWRHFEAQLEPLAGRLRAAGLSLD